MRNEPYIMRDPTAELSPVMRQRRSPPDDLRGRTVGVLSISKERSDEFLDTVCEQLEAHGVQIKRFRKPTHTKPAPEELLQSIIEQCDVVVEGLTD